MHAVVHDPILRAVRRSGETGMAHAVDLGVWVLIKHASGRVFLPGGRIHGVGADQFKLAETVIPVVAPGGGVDDELLAGGRVDELFGSFVGRQAHVDGAIVRRLLPRLVGPRDDGALAEWRRHRPWVRHLRDAQHAGPRDVRGFPARVDMVQSCRVVEVRPVDGELVVGVELGPEIVLGLPWVGGGGFEHEHAVVDCRTGEVAEHVLVGRWRVGVDVRREDDVPQSVDQMQLRCPEVIAVRGVHWW